MTTATLPALNVDMISNLITWAYADEKKISELMSDFDGWGSWDQGRWAEETRNGVCQTAYCMAGQAVVQSGYALALEFDEEIEEYDDNLRDYVKTGRKVYSATECYPARKAGKDAKGRQKYRRLGENVHISEKAKEILGLTYSEGQSFFAGSNVIGRLVYLANGFARVRGVELNLDSEIVALGEEYATHWNTYGSFPFAIYPDEVSDGISLADYTILYDNFGKVPESV